VPFDRLTWWAGADRPRDGRGGRALFFIFIFMKTKKEESFIQPHKKK
jgi:hypothetical protein